MTLPPGLQFAASRLRAFFLVPTSPLNLAVFRIVVFAEIVVFATTEDSVWLASLPPALLFPPQGLTSIAPHFLLGKEAATWISAGFHVSAICALLGLLTRFSTAVCAILGLYVFGIPQLFGKVDHWHHLEWFAVLLACAPCGAALSVDALAQRLRGRAAPEVVSAFPLRTAWILIGFIYFFPGLAKLRLVFIEWVFGDYVKLILHRTWSLWGPEYSPPLRVDQWPLLYRVGGLATIVFELSFIFLILNRRTRAFAIAAGLLFHLGVNYVMAINFRPLYVCYIAFIDWSFLSRFVTKHRPAMPLGVRRPSIAALAIGAILLFGAWRTGIRRINSWPFSIYPTFATVPGTTQTTLSVELLDAGGRPLAAGISDAVVAKFGQARTQHLLWRLSRTPENERGWRLRAFLQVLSENGVPVDRAETVRLYRDDLSTAPERRASPLIRRRQLAEFAVGD